MHRPISIGLLPEDKVSTLEALCRKAKEADERIHYQIVLLSRQGLSPPAIAGI